MAASRRLTRRACGARMAMLPGTHTHRTEQLMLGTNRLKYRLKFPSCEVIHAEDPTVSKRARPDGA
eukprot:360771-Chlamydomonas_euryale.AAC.4